MGINMGMVQAANDKLSGSAEMDAVSLREQLSALVDGELEGDQWAEAYAVAAERGGQATWDIYQLVGDVLRSSELARPRNPAVLAAVRQQMAAAPLAALPVHEELAPVAAELPRDAANASVFRWKMAAGFASLAAVAAIGWTSLSALQTSSPGGQLAAVPPERITPAEAPVVAVAEGDGQQVMLRDPRLDELLAAHKQFGSTSALQMPAGYLRNATFETPGR